MCSIQKIFKQILVKDTQHQLGMNVLPISLAVVPFFFILSISSRAWLDLTYGQVLTIVYMDLRPTRTYCFCVVKISYNETLSAERCPYVC